MSASNLPNKSVPIKKGRQRDVVYNILLECAALVKDEFWHQFYEDLAIGKSTKGIYIANGVIQTSTKRNGFSYNITDKAPEVILAELHHLLTTHTSICSHKDMNKKRLFVQELEAEFADYDKAKWTSIKHKNVRAMLLVDYAIYLNKIHALNWPATISAYQTITGAFESKTHSSKDVTYEGGKIRNIDDIEYIDGKIVNTRFDQVEEENITINESSSGILLQSLFDPYINAYIKTINV